MTERRAGDPPWGAHAVVIGLVGVLAFVAQHLATKPSTRSISPGLLGLVDIAAAFAEGMRALGIFLAAVAFFLGYAIASTLLLYLLRRRSNALLWAHGVCAAIGLVVLGQAAAWESRQRAALEAGRARDQARAEREEAARRAAAAQALEAARAAVEAELRAVRVREAPRRGREEKSSRFQLELHFASYLGTSLTAYRLRARGADWALPVVEGAIDPTPRAWLAIPVGEIRSAASAEAIERGEVQLELRFADGGWVAHPARIAVW